jgi:hypothetical protein
VIYSKDLYREQCRLHLEDDKGTYCKVEKTKEGILDDVFLKLKGILKQQSFDRNLENY